MERHVRAFSSNTEYSNYWQTNHFIPSKLFYNRESEEIIYDDYSKIPFTIEMLSAGTINLLYDYDGESDWTFREDISYVINGDFENVVHCDFDSWMITVQAGDKVSFWSDTEYQYSYYDSDSSNLGINYIHVDAPFIVYGNIHSLNSWSDELYPENNLPFDRCYGYYANFLAGNEHLISAKNLYTYVYAWDDVANWYSNFFADCTSLVEGPTVLPNSNAYCYYLMFAGCTSLIKAPELPSTSLENMCYGCMFSGCTSLTTAPKLAATTLSNDLCYNNMFNGCTNLSYVKCYAFEVNDGNPTFFRWLANVSPTGTFVQHPDALWERGDNGIPTGWTVKVDKNAPSTI